MISILDVGCRYGVYQLFSDNFEKFDYVAVDIDEDEIIRLKKKYNDKKIRFFSKFLGAEQKDISFKVSKHKGYGSSKSIDRDSVWFGLIRADETEIVETKEFSAEKSSVFMAKYVDNNSIVKLDIEGGELDFLRGLNDESFENIEAFVIEAHFDTPYETDSNFYSIGKFLKDKNYWAVSVQVEGGQVTKFYEEKDTLPLCSNVIFIKNSYKPTNYTQRLQKLEIMCEVLYALKLDGLLLHLLSTTGTSSIKQHRLFSEIKFVIGHKLNRLIKKPFIEKEEIEFLYSRIFDEKFPILSDFYESEFFNP
jgi:FkbM family methyltransferase